jgi:hypothetical protein
MRVLVGEVVAAYVQQVEVEVADDFDEGLAEQVLAEAFSLGSAERVALDVYDMKLIGIQ